MPLPAVNPNPQRKIPLPQTGGITGYDEATNTQFGAGGRQAGVVPPTPAATPSSDLPVPKVAPTPTSPTSDFAVPANVAAPAAPSALPAGATPPPGYVEPPGYGPGTAATTGKADLAGATRSKILDLIGREPGANLNDPVLKAQLAGFRVGQERNLERARAAAAEQAVGRGQAATTGFTQAALERARQGAGDAESQFIGTLMASELAAQRQQLVQALQLGAGILTEDQRAALQEKLGVMDINLREMLGKGQLNLGLLQTLLQNEQFGRSLGQQESQFGRTLGQQNYQFNTGLGAQLGMWGQSQNQQGLLSLLGLL